MRPHEANPLPLPRTPIDPKEELCRSGYPERLARKSRQFKTDDDQSPFISLLVVILMIIFQVGFAISIVDRGTILDQIMRTAGCVVCYIVCMFVMILVLAKMVKDLKSGDSDDEQDGSNGGDSTALPLPPRGGSGKTKPG